MLWKEVAPAKPVFTIRTEKKIFPLKQTIASHIRVVGSVNHGAGVDSRMATVGWDGVVVGVGKTGFIVKRLGNNGGLGCPGPSGWEMRGFSK